MPINLLLPEHYILQNHFTKLYIELSAIFNPTYLHFPLKSLCKLFSLQTHCYAIYCLFYLKFKNSPSVSTFNCPLSLWPPVWLIASLLVLWCFDTKPKKTNWIWFRTKPNQSVLRILSLKLLLCSVQSNPLKS